MRIFEEVNDRRGHQSCETMISSERERKSRVKLIPKDSYRTFLIGLRSSFTVKTIHSGGEEI